MKRRGGNRGGECLAKPNTVESKCSISAPQQAILKKKGDWKKPSRRSKRSRDEGNRYSPTLLRGDGHGQKGERNSYDKNLPGEAKDKYLSSETNRKRMRKKKKSRENAEKRPGAGTK